MLDARRTERRDRLIASAVLVALLAGWIVSFVDIKEVSLGLGEFFTRAAARHA